MDFVATTSGGVATTADAVAELFALLESVGELATVAVLLMDVPAVAVGAMVTLRVKVAAPPLALIERMEQLTVPFAPTAGVTHDQPPGALSEAKRSGAGRTSVIVMLEASLGPLSVTTIVYCSGRPGKTDEGARVFAMLRSKRTADRTLAAAESFAGAVSVVEETVAVAAIDVPDGVDERTRETMVNVAAVAGFIEVVSEQLTVPFAPAAGVVQLQPAGAETETNVV